MHIGEIYMAQGTALGRFYGPKRVSKSEPYILGSTVSGTIVGLGEGVDRFSISDEVIVIPNETGEHGSWATYRCVTQKNGDAQASRDVTQSGGRRDHGRLRFQRRG